MPDGVLGGCTQARAPVTDVVRIRPGEHGRESSPSSEGRQLVVELALAVVAAVAIVPPVPLSLELGGRDRLVLDADRTRDVARAVELAGRQGR